MPCLLGMGSVAHHLISKLQSQGRCAADAGEIRPGRQAAKYVICNHATVGATICVEWQSDAMMFTNERVGFVPVRPGPAIISEDWAVLPYTEGR
jgi:hypothetical protein